MKTLSMRVRAARWLRASARAPALLRAQKPEKPQYGGTLEVGTMFVSICRRCRGIRHDWNWKLNHDTGQFYEQLCGGDLDKTASARAASIRFVADA